MKTSILLLQLYKSYGGAENQINLLTKRIFRSKNVKVLYGSNNVRNKRLNILITSINAFRYIFSVDIFFYYNLFFFPVALIFSFFGKKVIYSERILSKRNHKRLWIYKLFFKKTPIIVNSLETKNFLIKFAGCTKVFFIPNEVPSIDFKRKEPNYESLSIAIISRLSQEKGIFDFLKDLNKNFQGKINLYYSSSEKNYEKMIRDIVVKNNLNVNFKGKAQLSKIFSENDLVMHPSFFEGTSNVVLECLKNNFPIYCRNIPQNTILGIPGELTFASSSEMNSKIENFNLKDYEENFFQKNQILIDLYKQKCEIKNLLEFLK